METTVTVVEPDSEPSSTVHFQPSVQLQSESIQLRQSELEPVLSPKHDGGVAPAQEPSIICQPQTLRTTDHHWTPSSSLIAEHPVYPSSSSTLPPQVDLDKSQNVKANAREDQSPHSPHTPPLSLYGLIVESITLATLITQWLTSPSTQDQGYDDDH